MVQILPDLTLSNTPYTAMSGAELNALQQSSLSAVQYTQSVATPMLNAVQTPPTITVPGIIHTSTTMGSPLATPINVVNDTVPPIISVNNPIACNVSHATKQKIVSGQFVDLATLLQTDATEAYSRHLYINNVGELVAKEKPSTKISSIEQWTNAFLLFSAVYITAHPSQAGDLIKYMHNIRSGAERTPGLGFKLYDEQFRLKRVMDPSMSFGKIDNELWLMYMANATSQSTNFHAMQYVNTHHNQKCFDFNYKGICPRYQCKYSHTCIQCGMQHPITQHNFGFRAPNQTRPFRQYQGFRPRGFDFGQRGPRQRMQRF